MGCLTSFEPENCQPCPTKKPGSDFFCEYGKWVSIGVNTTGTIITTGGGVTVVEGNMTVSNGSIIVNVNSSISVQGCSDLSGNVTLIISPEDIETWALNSTRTSKTLLYSALGWCKGNPNMAVSVQGGAKKSGCKKFSHRTEQTSTAIIVYFDIDSSGCFSWWPIILGVFGAVIVVVLVLVIFFRVNKKAAMMIWPYPQQEADLPVFEHGVEEEQEMRSFLTQPLLTQDGEENVPLNE